MALNTSYKENIVNQGGPNYRERERERPQALAGKYGLKENKLSCRSLIAHHFFTNALKQSSLVIGQTKAMIFVLKAAVCMREG